MSATRTRQAVADTVPIAARSAAIGMNRESTGTTSQEVVLLAMALLAWVQLHAHAPPFSDTEYGCGCMDNDSTEHAHNDPNTWAMRQTPVIIHLLIVHHKQHYRHWNQE